MTNPNTPAEFPTERINWLMEAVETVHHRWYLFSHSTSPIAQADALVSLNDAIFDLSTYHPNWDSDSGTLREPEVTEWVPTHRSLEDGSITRLVLTTNGHPDDPIILENEDGVQWTDIAKYWEEI